jgi:RimJ/RimL family protein N-acetyltransferase
MHRMLLDIPAQLETERLILRPYRSGDGQAYYEMCLRNKDHLLAYESDNPVHRIHTPEEAEILVRQFSAEWISRDAFFLGVWDRSNPTTFVAQIYIGVVTWELPEFILGYFVDEEHEGQGFVTEAVKAALKFAFLSLQAYRVRLCCNDTNVRSYQVAERCGFVREGHLRQTQKRVMFPDGSFSGEYIYGILRSEFEAASKA